MGARNPVQVLWERRPASALNRWLSSPSRFILDNCILRPGPWSPHCQPLAPHTDLWRCHHRWKQGCGQPEMGFRDSGGLVVNLGCQLEGLKSTKRHPGRVCKGTPERINWAKKAVLRSVCHLQQAAWGLRVKLRFLPSLAGEHVPFLLLELHGLSSYWVLGLSREQRVTVDCPTLLYKLT